LHVTWLAGLARAATLLALLVLLVPRAAFRSLEHARTSPGYRVPAAVVLVPLMVAAALSFR
jgi:hypothetical protein